MKKWLGIDSPIMYYLGKLVDLVVLNFLVILCSLPIFTIGASVSALYDAVTRLQKEEGGIYRRFFFAFKENFMQATALWLILLAIGVVSGICLWIYAENDMQPFVVLSVLLLLIWTMVVTWVFPLQAHFHNSVVGTLKNAFLCSLGYLPRTFLMTLLNVIPVGFVFGMTTFGSLGLLCLVIWFSLTAECNLRILRKPFSVLENKFAVDSNGDPNG